MRTPLVLVAHGSRDAAADACVRELAGAVGVALPGVPVRIGYVDVRAPDVAAAVAGLRAAVVVPAFLGSGYHVRHDLPGQLAAAGADPGRFRVTDALGADPLLARVALHRLVEAGWRPGDAVVLAAAGSSDQGALGEVRAAGRMLSAAVGRRVRVGYAAAATPRVDALVTGLRTAGERRVAVASWLLAPGVFQSRLRATGAEVVAAPLGAHPGVVDAVVARYRCAAGELPAAA